MSKLTHLNWDIQTYDKIAFQQVAYRPLVDRITQHALRRGVWSGGVVPGPDGVSAPGGAWSQGVVSQHALRQTPHM